MSEMQREFMGHVTINRRIYELVLEEIGTAQEKLTVNGELCYNYPSAYFHSHLKKRSIWIENYMVHFVNVHGLVTLEVESRTDGRTSLEEQGKIPVFEGNISRISVNEEYLKNSSEDHLRQWFERGKKIFSVLFIGCYWLSLLYLDEAQCKQVFQWLMLFFFVAEMNQWMQESKYWASKL